MTSQTRITYQNHAKIYNDLWKLRRELHVYVLVHVKDLIEENKSINVSQKLHS
jgi:hypothetical protein